MLGRLSSASAVAELSLVAAVMTALLSAAAQAQTSGELAPVASDRAQEPAAALDTDDESDAADAADWLPEGVVVESAEGYVVEAQAPQVPPPGVEIELSRAAYGSDLARQLDAAPGARALRSGGSLAPSELRVRGLGGARLAISLDGIPIDDSASGQVDLTELDSEHLQSARLLRGPEAGNLAPGALAGTLALQTAPPPDGLQASLRSSLGSHGSVRMSSRFGYGESGSGAVVALLVGRSEGDFGYRPVSFSADSPLVGELRQRENNDHARYGASLVARLDGDALQSRLLAQFARHAGGVAGLSGHPTPSARFEADSVLVGNRTSYFLPSSALGVELSARLRETHFSQRERMAVLESRDQLSSLRGALTLDIEQVLGPLDTSFAVEARRSEVQPLSLDDPYLEQQGQGRAARAERSSVGGLARLRLHLLERRLAVDGAARLDAISDVGLEPSVSARLSAALAPSLLAELYTGRAFRAPTFHEKYGPPLGYVSSNPELEPEDGVEVGAALRFHAARSMVELSLFGARLSHAILYLNRNAFEVRPENTGPLWRGGGELTAALRATRFLTQSAVLELLISRVDATGAAMPTSPLLRLRSRSELALAELWTSLPLQLYFDASAQSSSSSNFYGELTVPAQAKLDAGLAWQLAPGSALSIEISNVLNADWRVDLHQVPLPGRQVTASLSLGV